MGASAPLIIAQHHVSEMEDLWVQKPDWNVDTMLALFGDAPNVYAFGIYRGDDRIGAMLCVTDPIYESFIVDTLVIDRPHRSISTLREIVRASGPFVVAMARATGCRRWRVSMRGARMALRWWPHGEIQYETVGGDIDA